MKNAKKYFFTMILLSLFSVIVKAQTWISMSSPTSQNLMSVFFLSQDTGFVAGNNGAIFKTTNGGSTWTSLTSPTLNNISKIYFLTKDSGYALSGTLLYKTINGGSTWNYLGSFASAGSIYFWNSSYGYIRGTNYIWRTLNGGANWDSTLISAAGSGNYWYEINFVSPAIGYTSNATNSIWQTTNGGSSWSLLYTYSSIMYQLEDFKFYNSNIGVALVGFSAGFILRTNNGGMTWSSKSLPSPSNVTKIAMTSIKKMFILGGYNMYSTNDTGNTWTLISNTFSATDFFMVNDSIGYAVGSGGIIYKTYPGAVSAPSTAASTFFIGSITNTSMILNWTSGNGTARIVEACAVSNTLNAPSYGVSYTASSTFGNGSQIGTGNYVVYNGTGSSCTVTGLSLNTAYFFRVYEYNGTGTNTNYLTSSYATNGAMTLPVQLISFDAKLDNNKNVNLNWSTASEVNNDYFEIQRSEACLPLSGLPCRQVGSQKLEDWVVIGKVKGHGTSDIENNYQFTDNLSNLQLLSSNLYYRLKQVDFDGNSTLSDVRVVNLNQEKINDVTIYPNPATTEFKIESGKFKIDNCILQLFDITGKLVLQSAVSGQQSAVSLKELQSGIYFLKINDANGAIVKMQKVVVMK